MSTEPFLPGQGKAKFFSKPGRTIVLWLVLIVMFCSIYQVFSQPAPGRHAPGHHPAPDPFSGRWASELYVVILFVGVGWVVWQRRRLRSVNVMNGEALELLGRGELQKAHALFETMGQKFRRVVNVRALAQYNVACVSLLEGQLEHATSELVALGKRDGLSPMPWLKVTAAANLALCHALAGNFELATPWLEEAEKNRATAADPMRLTGTLTLVRAIMACRRGQPAEATRLIDRDWQGLEGLSGEQLRPLRLLRAFAASSTGGPRDDGAVDRLLAPLRESRPGSLRYLTVAWPELGAFMDLHHV